MLQATEPTRILDTDTPDQPDQLNPPPSMTTNGLHLVVDFAWSKWQNRISEVDPTNPKNKTPLYIQHFRLKNPTLTFEAVDAAGNPSGNTFATGTTKWVSISGGCNIRGQDITIKPLKRWKTAYNYLSPAFAPASSPPVPISWKASMSFKRWDFICFDGFENPIAKFAVNMWGIKQVGQIYFENSKEAVSQEVRDEVVVTGLTVFYIMYTRVNNPLNIAGAFFAKPGKVDEGSKGKEVDGEVAK